MPKYISLFRSINVGGRQVRMAELKAFHESLGLQDVVTYIQSGNVIFSSENANPAQIAREIEEGFAQKFGFHSTVMVRTAGQLDEIVANNPFQEQLQKEPKWVLVLFLAGQPAPTALADLRLAYAGPEEYQIIGQEMYLYYPEGVGRSKLTGTLLERKLQTAGTGRNWNTVLQLQKMLE